MGSSQSMSKPDLRSPRIAKIRRGFAIGHLRFEALVLLDTLAIVVAWWLAVHFTMDTPTLTKHDFSFLFLVLVVKLGITSSRSLYKPGIFCRDYFGFIKAISLAELTLLLVAHLYEPRYYASIAFLIISWFFNIIIALSFRKFVETVTDSIRKRGAVCYPVFLVCDSPEQHQNSQLINQEHRYNILGVTDSSVLDKDNRKDFFEKIHELGIAEVFVSWSSIKNRLHLCWHFQNAGVLLWILPSNQERSIPNSGIYSLGGVPVMTIRPPAIIGSDYWTKRCFDFCFALLLLLVLSPVLLAISVLIKLDSPGAIFFRQTRIGLHGKKFKVWKFRTMVSNADKLQAALEAKNKMKDGVLFKLEADPRVTRVGRTLRGYSLDELPQLFNILVGEMSFVGPRPLPERDVERFKEHHFIRQEVMPGITGLWQVSGRSDIENFEDVVRLDIEYISNWSVWSDVSIIFQTVRVVLARSGAY